MPTKGKTITILVAEDDEDDRLLMQEALEENRLANDLHFVVDGEELMDYLLHRGKFSDPKSAPHPSLILLDLNMPRKDGREALKEIKADPKQRWTRSTQRNQSRSQPSQNSRCGTDDF